MKLWFRILALPLAMAFATGCAPADPKVKTVRQRVLAGETVTFDKPGYTLCGKNAWTDMRLADSDERERVVLHKQASVLAAGHSACYRVGDTINLGVNGRQLKQAGMVRIDALSLVLFDKLSASKLKGAFFASSNNFNDYTNVVKLRMKPDQENIVTVVDITYIKGSAADEAALRQKDNDDQNSDGYVETKADGDLLPGSGCKKPYTYIAIPAELKDDFTSSKLQSWYTLTDFSCLAQGATVDLSMAKDTPAVGQVKITKIKKFRVKWLDPKFFVMAANYDFKTVRDHVTKDNTKDSEWMVVVDFTLVPPTGGQ